MKLLLISWKKISIFQTLSVIIHPVFPPVVKHDDSYHLSPVQSLHSCNCPLSLPLKEKKKGGKGRQAHLDSTSPSETFSISLLSLKAKSFKNNCLYPLSVIPGLPHSLEPTPFSFLSLFLHKNCLFKVTSYLYAAKFNRQFSVLI